MTNHFAVIASYKVHRLIKVTADLADVDVKELCINRSAPVFIARATAMWIMKNELKISYSEIGRAFNKDHTTVINALRRADNMMKSHSMLRSLRDKLMDKAELKVEDHG